MEGGVYGCESEFYAFIIQHHHASFVVHETALDRLRVRSSKVLLTLIISSFVKKERKKQNLKKSTALHMIQKRVSKEREIPDTTVFLPLWERTTQLRIPKSAEKF